jgi:hypothetical protein
MRNVRKERERMAERFAKSKNPRHLAWRNVMVAAINAGLDQGIFGLDPCDNRWPGHIPPASNSHSSEGHGEYRFNLADDIPAVAHVSAITGQELRFNVAAWPNPDAVSWMVGTAEGALDYWGDAGASGSLERLTGRWLQCPILFGAHTFSCRRTRLAELAALTVEPNGYADHGRFFL